MRSPRTAPPPRKAGREIAATFVARQQVGAPLPCRERRRLQGDLALLPSAVEGALRFEPPVQLTDRAVVEPVELAGVRLERGTIVAALLAAANRDPEYFAEPERFDVGRHLSFGLGNHFCLGAALARLEAQVTLGALLRPASPIATGRRSRPRGSRRLSCADRRRCRCGRTEEPRDLSLLAASADPPTARARVDAGVGRRRHP
jgi:cytochrome P450